MAQIKQQNNKVIRNQQEANDLQRQANEETKRHNLAEESTKDRVDISKKEYLELLETKERLEKEVSNYKEIMDRILKPFVVNRIDQKLYDAVFSNQFQCRVVTNFDAQRLVTEVAVIYTIPQLDLK